MWYSYRFRAYPERTGLTAEAEYHIDVHRQLYNHALYDYNTSRRGTPSKFEQQNRLPEWKERWPVFADLHSKAAQRTVHRLHENLASLSGRKENGHRVGRLRWQAPRDYRSVTYNQSGFDLDDNEGRDGYAHVRLSKIGWISIRLHREIPDHVTIKEVTLKKEPTGEWYVTFGVEITDDELPEKPALEEVDTENSVGVDLGVINYIHTSDGLSVAPIDLSEEYERLRKAQSVLARRERGSKNWEKARRRVASVKRRISRKVLDFQHKLTTWLCREYDAVFVEDLNVTEMLEQPWNSRNTQDAAWRQFIQMLEYKAELYGCYVRQIEPAGTSEECAKCGAVVEKRLRDRVHHCPSCGFEIDRDWNAALNVLQRGFEGLGSGWPEGTPVETALPADRADACDVSAERVVEAGTPGS